MVFVPENESTNLTACIASRLASRAHSSDVAIVAPGRTALTHGELFSLVEQTLEALNRLGVGRNDRVGVVLPNGPEMATAFLAVSAAATCAPLNPGYRVNEFEFYLSDLDAKALIVQAGLDSPARAAARSLGIPILELSPLMEEGAGSFSLSGKPRARALSPGFARPDDVAMVLHTSGTTARPKIVPLTHRNLCRSAKNIADALSLGASDRCLNLMPLFHIHGLMAGTLAPLACGGSTVCVPGFFAPKFCEWLRDFDPSWYTAVPTMHQAILSRVQQKLDTLGEHRLRFIRSSSAPLPRPVMAELESTFEVPVIEAYGMTEAAHQICSNPLPPRDRRPGSVGLSAGPDVAIMCPDGSFAPAGQLGEIVIRGENITLGYENNPTANEAAFTDRWFHTGDQGFIDADHYVFLTGRLKELINRAGEKISPPEVDGALLAHPAVAQAVAFSVPHPTLGEEVGAAVILKPGATATETEILDFVALRLADFKVPVHLVITTEIPKGPTGKLQRIGLAERLGLGSGAAAAPVTPPTASTATASAATERLLVDIWQQVLGVERVGVNDGFIALGGDSVLATQVISRLRDATGVQLSFRAFFGAQTVSAVARLIDSGATPTAASGITKAANAGPTRLSFAQEGLWFLHELHRGSTAYNTPFGLRLRGRLDRDALERSLDELVRRHDVLRATIAWDGTAPVQTVLPHAPHASFALVVEELAESPESVAPSIATEEARRPFDLERGPLARFRVLRLGAEDHLLLITTHHLVSDGWSKRVMQRELLERYVAHTSGEPGSVPEPVLAYSDFATWQRAWFETDDAASQLAYWKQHLGGAPFVLELPFDRPRPAVQTFAGAALRFDVPDALTAAVAALGREEGVTPFMTLFACFNVLLHRYTAQPRVIVGVPIANRNRTETEGLVGYVGNTLALATDLSGNPTFRELLTRVRDVALGGYAHQDLPFEKVVDALQPERNLSVNPIAQVMFDLQNASASESLEAGGLAVTRFPVETGSARFDLTFELEPRGQGLGGTVVYNTDLFDAATIERLVGHFLRLLGGAVADREAPLSGLPLLHDDEQRRVLVEWNDTATEWSTDATLHQLFEEQVARSPDAVAVTCEGEERTYRQLNAEANRLAHHLIQRGVGPSAVVGVCVPRSISQIVSLLGVVKAGGAYVSLDPGYPDERLAFLLKDSGARIVLATGTAPKSLRGADVIQLDAIALGGHPEHDPAPRARPDDVLVTIYTSGSTGGPKGVLATHRGFVNRLRWMASTFPYGPAERACQKTALSFVDSVAEVFGPLTHGVPLDLIPEPTVRDAGAFVEALAAAGTTRLVLVPSLLRAMLDMHDDLAERLPRLRHWTVSGETLSGDLASRFARRLPGRVLLNLYGSSEVSADVTWEVVSARPAGSPVRIGRPIANVQVFVVDETFAPVPIGFVGEVVVGGAALARGYHGQPALTEQKFVANPFSGDPGARLYRTGDRARWLADGALEYIGRIDHQVKIRGLRVELGEVEAAIRDNVDVGDCAVLAIDDPSGGKRLLAYVVPAKGRTLAVAALRDFLADRLPEHVVPGAFMTLDALPLNPSGKVDRRALPAPERFVSASSAAYAAPRSVLEELIASVWRDLLRLDRVGVDDNFFEIGGNSLLVVVVQTELKKKLPPPSPALSLVDFFAHPTVARLAAHLSGSGAGEPARRPTKRATAQAAEGDAIAVIGLSCRFPGARNPGEFWKNLRDGVESISTFTDAELRAAGVDEATLRDPHYVKRRPFLEGCDLFDAPFFGMSPREAAVTDPTHRLFLECAWEALESAGYDPKSAGRVGVYAGSWVSHYTNRSLRTNPEAIEAYSGREVTIGNVADFIATRVSYKLNLSGPSVNVQTACSTSLVATIWACRSLLHGECDMALAGGASVNPYVSGYHYREGEVDSPDGHCRAFDAAGRGTVLGDGVGIVALKRLADALEDGDEILAVIRGVGLNNDGSDKVGFMAPSVSGQAGAIREALDEAGFDPETVSYVEAHGTATPMGDPIEIAALTRVFRERTPKKQFCAIGSVKTNVGHLNTVAGVAGLIKTVLSLKNKELPPSLHFREPNPEIDFANSPFFVNASLCDWTATGPRRAGVSSFGIGGTNAHVLLEEAPARGESASDERPPYLLVLSARSAKALEEQAKQYARYLSEHPEARLADVCHTAAVGRTHFEHRLGVVGTTRETLIADLETVARGEETPEDVARGRASAARPRVAFLFPGQGSQYVGMGRALFESEPVFRTALEQCAAAMDPLLDRPLLSILYPKGGETSSIDGTEIAQPAIFAVAVSLAALWRSWGVEPDIVVGQSQGEIAAACVAGALSLADAAKVVCRRSRLLLCASGRGGMAAVGLSEAQALERIAPFGGRLWLAVINGPSSTVISGEKDALEALVAELTKEAIFCRLIKVDYASHSPQMDILRDDILADLCGIEPRAGSVALYSTVTATKLMGEELGPEYWVRNLREPVRFGQVLSQLVEQGFDQFVEISAQPLLATALSAYVDPSSAVSVPSLHRDRGDRETLAKSLGELHVRGAKVDWNAFDGPERRRVALPTYPFQRSRHWIAPKGADLGHRASTRAELEANLYEIAWREPSRRAAAEKAPPGRWLVVGDGAGLGAAVVEELQARGATASQTVLRGRHLAELLTEQGAVRGIVHLASLDGLGVESALEIVESVQAVAGGDAPPPAITFVTRGANAVGEASRSQPIAVAQAPLWAFGRVLSIEEPSLWGGLVDLPPAAASGEVAALVDELLGHSESEGEDQVALRDGQRFVARLARHRLPEEASAPWQTDGTWLVTGGLGALGRHVARWLVERGVKSLVLTGRRGLATPGAEEAMADLEARGASVRVLARDVALAHDVDAVLDTIDADLPPLRGIIHAAGISTVAPIRETTPESLAEVLAPKVDGAWLLHERTRDRALEAFVTFSSVASVLGGAGQAAYSAANGFLDALAHERRRLGLPALSVNWGLWDDGGMATGERRKQLERSGLHPMATADALAALDALLSTDAPQVTVARVDWPRFREAYEARRPRMILSEMERAKENGEPVEEAVRAENPDWVAELRAVPAPKRSTVFRDHVRAEVARTLGFDDVAAVDVGRGFFSMGMDSLIAVDLCRRLERRLARRERARAAGWAGPERRQTSLRVRAPTVFNHPTVDQLSRHLMTKLGLLAEETVAPAVTSAAAPNEPIAIVGMACRFPGGATDANGLWDLLDRGVDAVRPITPDRWDMASYYDPDPDAQGKMYVREHALIEGHDRFDPAFFGISAREARSMDPQQRLLLESAVHALEDAGLVTEALRASRVGVFAGMAASQYLRGGSSPEELASLDAYASTGNMLSMAAGRVSFTLGVQGPSLTVDTGCSSSLVALHLACQSLRQGECEVALAGGVTVLVSPAVSVSLSRLRALAPDGRCKAFSAQADGFGRGEGCGVVVLKRLSQARADGDRILAVVRGSAVNHDGMSSGLTVPNGKSQEATIRLALANAGVSAGDVSYVEAHGTGTALGDPIEIEALAATYGRERSPEDPLLVGTVKTNIAHLEAAAGVAGLMKVIVSLAHERLPKHLHCVEKNPHIAWDTLPIAVTTEAHDWPRGERPRLAGVSSFGMSGTNAHVIVEEAPARVDAEDTKQERPAHVLLLSGRSPNALEEQARQYARHLGAHPEIRLADACHTAAVGRTHFEHRLGVVATTREGLIADLEAIARGDAPESVVRGEASAEPPKVAFLFSGQGSQYVGMARELFETQPLFKAAFERCAEALERGNEAFDRPLLSVLYLPDGPSDGEASPIDETAYTQPALFALQYALTVLLGSFGVEPAAVIGHSVGEYAAACAAGVFSLDDGAKLIAARGRLMQKLPLGGAMVSVRASEERVRAALVGYERTVSIAAVNAATQTVISGVEGDVLAICAALAKDQIETKRLKVSHAFHSPLMAPMLDEFRKVAESVTYAPPRISLFGNVDGKEVGGEIAHADYWVRHVLAPVRFADGLAALVASGITELVEIGPKPVLMGLRTDSPGTAGTMWAPSLRKDRGDWATLGKSLAALHTRGVNVDWTTFDAPYRHSRVALPTYPFQRERYWHDRQKVRAPEAEPVETPTTPFRADLVAELRKMSAAAREASLQATLEEEAGRVLGLESISPVRPLRELGLDSIAAVELRDRMANRIGRPLPATLAFDHPTLEAQTRYLLQVCDLLESPAPAPVAPHVEADRLESIAGLTDEQIVSALQSRLEEISGDLA